MDTPEDIIIKVRDYLHNNGAKINREVAVLSFGGGYIFIYTCADGHEVCRTLYALIHDDMICYNCYTSP
jgi:hypothetical protein